MRHMAVERVDRVRLTSQMICMGRMDATVSMIEVSNSMDGQLLSCLPRGMLRSVSSLASPLTNKIVVTIPTSCQRASCLR